MYKQRILDLEICSVWLESDLDISGYQFIHQKNEKEVFPDVKDLTYVKINTVPDGKEHFVRCYIEDCVMEFESYPEPDERIEIRTYENKEGTTRLSIGCWGECWPDDASKHENDFDYEVGWPDNGLSYLIKDYTETKSYVFSIGWISYPEKIDGDSDVGFQLWSACDLTHIC